MVKWEGKEIAQIVQNIGSLYEGAVRVCAIYWGKVDHKIHNNDPLLANMLISAGGGEGNGLGSVVCGFELFDECISFARNIGEEIPWRENSLASKTILARKFLGEKIFRRGTSLASIGFLGGFDFFFWTFWVPVLKGERIS